MSSGEAPGQVKLWVRSVSSGGIQIFRDGSIEWSLRSQSQVQVLKPVSVNAGLRCIRGGSLWF